MRWYQWPCPFCLRDGSRCGDCNGSGLVFRMDLVVYAVVVISVVGLAWRAWEILR
jgi:hypothetical protein